jgi:hypothetical protein
VTSARSIRRVLVWALVGIAALPATGCGSTAGRAGTSAAVAGRPAEAGSSAHFARVREAVLRGAAQDFAQGTGIGGPAYESCVLGGLRAVLDPPTITELVAVYRRTGGQQFAAQALNQLASRLGARCGHRWYVPELVEASRGLRDARLTGGAVAKLGVSYGPILAVHCRRADHVGCDRVGLDVVFRSAAARVTAVVGNRRLRLHTPGMHGGARHRDWAGTLAGAGLGRRASPLHVNGYGRGDEVWAGSPPVYVPIELRVRFADGRRESALFPRVFLSPQWSRSVPRRGRSAEGVGLPAGWHEVNRPITAVLYPVQVLAAATYPITIRRRPRSCWPTAALRQMPADGVLLQLLEYAPRDSVGRPVRVPRLPHRPRRFSYAGADHEPFECAGLSYKFAFEQGGRAFQAQIWFDRKTVEPRLRAGALQILDGFRPARPWREAPR